MIKKIGLLVLCFVFLSLSARNLEASDKEYFYNNFVKNSGNYYFQECAISDVDTESIEILSGYIFKDKNDVYSANCRQGTFSFNKLNADPKTFKAFPVTDPLSAVMLGYDKDAIYGYSDCYTWTCYPVRIQANTTNIAIQGGYIITVDTVIRGGSSMRELEDVDVSTFEVIGNNFAKDKNSIYFFGSKIEEIDVDTFEVLSDTYSKDKNRYYTHGAATLPQFLDEATEADNLSREFTNIKDGYTKNAFFVFLNNKIINGADPNSFQVMDFPYSKDKDRVYYFWDEIISSDIGSFKKLDNDYSGDNKYVYYKNLIVEDADPISFRLNYKDDYQAEDSKNYYSKGKILREKNNTGIIISKNNILFSRLKGRIVLKVEDAGKAYYLNPRTNAVYYLGRPDDAFKVMREQGVGISEKDFRSFGENAPSRLAGVILLRVEAKGEAYYVNPTDKKMHYLGRPADAFGVMRSLGLGISNADFDSL